MLGTATLVPEVTHISKHGFWILWADEEFLLPFDQFPWFRKENIDQISEVEAPTSNHLYWPQLDIDLSVDSIRKPEDFPLVSAT
ncbi:MAG: DUF2442 domain-containing protein [Burkholderiaceae bacterium]|nr:DUF2442 domain-containing protein [Burkholderiaceae bacterium]